MVYAQNDATRKKLEAMGWPRKKIYEAKDGETWDKITLYKGECLGILGGLKAFGKKPAIRNALARFKKQGAVIMDLETGWNSVDDLVEMLDASAITRRFTPEEKAARAKDAANNRRKKSGAMIDYDARIAWKRQDGLSVEEKAEHIGWPRASLAKAFGPSGNPPGRRPKQVSAD